MAPFLKRTLRITQPSTNWLNWCWIRNGVRVFWRLELKIWCKNEPKFIYIFFLILSCSREKKNFTERPAPHPHIHGRQHPMVYSPGSASSARCHVVLVWHTQCRRFCHGITRWPNGNAAHHQAFKVQVSSKKFSSSFTHTHTHTFTYTH